MPQFRVHRLVEEEFREAFRWYSDRSPQAAENFSTRFSQLLAGLERNPRKHAFWKKPFRRIRLMRFPYIVIYHETTTTLSVLALVHEHREPLQTLSSLGQRTKIWRE
jgi:plasmid stabilization system protein ParE